MQTRANLLGPLEQEGDEDKGAEDQRREQSSGRGGARGANGGSTSRSVSTSGSIAARRGGDSSLRGDRGAVVVGSTTLNSKLGLQVTISGDGDTAGDAAGHLELGTVGCGAGGGLQNVSAIGRLVGLAIEEDIQIECLQKLIAVSLIQWDTSEARTFPVLK